MKAVRSDSHTEVDTRIYDFCADALEWCQNKQCYIHMCLCVRSCAYVYEVLCVPLFIMKFKSERTLVWIDYMQRYTNMMMEISVQS